MAENISVSVGLSPLVQSVKTGVVGEKISLVLISGLTPSGIVWRSMDDQHEVPTLESIEVVFDLPGFYRPVVLTHLQHDSYGITITEN